MSPPDDKNTTKPKHTEIREGKQKQFFSFRWLLRKSKSSKFSKEVVTQSEKRSNVPASKSCDTGLTNLESVDRCPTFLLWKLLPPAGKSNGPTKNGPTNCSNKKLPFRSSFSCSDVHHLASSSNPLSSAASTREISLTVNSQSHSQKTPARLPSQSWYRLYRSSAGISNLDSFAKSPSLLCSDEFSARTSQSILCKLCLVMMPAKKMFTLQDCSCMFCIMCLRQYLTISIKEGNIPITCPDAKCPDSGKILISEIKEIAGDDALIMFERYKLNLDVDLDPARVWCPSPGCETICTLPNTNQEEGVLVHCPSCRLKFCSECKLRWHGQVTCEEARKALNDEIELSISEDESWIKRCPNCRIPIEKDEGCAQMMCYRCKHVFCWHCLTSLDDDFLLRHYDKGPCRNMLGHSRASMIWHRTQVVGIFAGFSFLLLVASPFLLLAAPCLLCCRCRSRLLYEEATPL